MHATKIFLNGGLRPIRKVLINQNNFTGYQNPNNNLFKKQF
jgi:hypothetical protein